MSDEEKSGGPEPSEKSELQKLLEKQNARVHSKKCFLVLPLKEILLLFLNLIDMAIIAQTCKTLRNESREAIGFINRYLEKVPPSHIVFMLGGRSNLANMLDLGKLLYCTETAAEEVDAAKSNVCPPMRLGRQTFQQVSLPSKVYAIGGSFGTQGEGTIEIFDCLSKKWTLQTQLLPPGLAYMTATEFNGKIFIIGGARRNAQNTSWEGGLNAVFTSSFRSLDGQVWTQSAANLNFGRDNHAAVVYDGKLLVAGGIASNRQKLSSVEVLDPFGAGRWEIAPNMIKRRSGLSLLVVKGSLYAVGGDENSEEISIEKMDRDTKIWQMITLLNVNRIGSAAVSIGSKIVLLGGSSVEGSEERLTWDAFDLITLQWASQTLSAKTRGLPRNDFYYGCAVVVNVSWTDILD